MRDQKRKAALEFIKGALGVILLVALIYIADWTSVVSALRDISLQDIALLLALAAILILVSVVKWRLFLSRLGISASLGHLYRLYLVGYFINLVMPSYVGGDVVRSLYVGKDVDRVHAVSATLLERYTGFVAMIVMSVAALLVRADLPNQIVWLVLLVASGAAVGSMALFTGRVSRIMRGCCLPLTWVALAEKIERGLVWGLKDRRLLLQAGGLSLLFHLLTIVNTVAVAHAVGWDSPPLLDLCVVVPLILLVGALPISPQGLGIQEGAFLYFLHLAGASEGQALAIGLVLRAKSYLLALVGGALFLTVQRPRASESVQAP